MQAWSSRSPTAQRYRAMADPKPCADCHRIRPAEAFHKTQGGAGRGDRCRECIERRVVAYKANKQREQEELEAELVEFLSVFPNKPIPGHLEEAFSRFGRGPTRKRQPRKLSNRPHMTRCAGCGEAVPKRELWEYRPGTRARYCRPCMVRRFVERECAGCSQTKLTREFFEGLRAVSPYCIACRQKREQEKHCPRCDLTKPAAAYTQSGGKLSGWCKQCNVETQRQRRAAARSRTG
jgi:hypothetical protein